MPHLDALSVGPPVAICPLVSHFITGSRTSRVLTWANSLVLVLLVPAVLSSHRDQPDEVDEFIYTKQHFGHFESTEHPRFYFGASLPGFAGHDYAAHGSVHFYTLFNDLVDVRGTPRALSDEELDHLVDPRAERMITAFVRASRREEIGEIKTGAGAPSYEGKSRLVLASAVFDARPPTRSQ